MGPGSPREPVVHVAAVCAIFGRVGQLSRRSIQCTTDFVRVVCLGQFESIAQGGDVDVTDIDVVKIAAG